MRYGYARVSSEEQSLARQRSQLSAAGCDQFVEEIQSGVKARLRLDRLLAGLDAGDELVVTELDRLGRSTGEAVLLMDDLIRRRLIADILASLAAHERRRTRERQRQGIVAAKAAGRHLGRPPKLNGQQIAEARARLAGDEPVRVVARAYGVSDKTLRATLARGAR
mgnify:CR=1 FL=1